MPKGRPALSGTAKQILFQIRVTDSERQLLDSAAGLAGKPTSTWARDLLLTAARIAALQQKPATKKAPSVGKKPKA